MKKTGAAALIILLIIGGGLYWLWRQATLLPEWYAGGEATSDQAVIIYAKGMGDIRRSLERTVEDRLRKTAAGDSDVRIELNENDANKLFATLISENTEAYPCLQAIKASRTRIRNGRLDFGVVVDASDVLKGASGRGVQGIRPKATRLSGLLQGKEVALGFTGKYGIADGKLQLDKEGKIRIGGLTFSLKTITKRLGVSEDHLKKTLKDIELGKFKIDDIEPIRNTLLLRGAPPTS